jgi:hypothetical protein
MLYAPPDHEAEIDNKVKKGKRATFDEDDELQRELEKI